MSRAYTKEEHNEQLADVGERPVSQERNLVTEEGLKFIERQLHDLKQDLGQATRQQDRMKMATLSSDLRYWQARRDNAELFRPDPNEKTVRFGMTVTVRKEDGRPLTWKIVGEDEADPGKGKISHVSPMAKALFGKSVGDVVIVNDDEWEIISLAIV